MIIEINENNIEELESNELTKYLIEELNINPFSKIYIYKEKEVLGYLYFSFIYDRVEINQIEVLNEYRNLGIGNKLIKELINNYNYDITLEVRVDNTYAIKLYEKNNFRKVA